MSRSRLATPVTALLVFLVAVLLLRPTGYLRPVEDVLATVLAPVQYSLHWVSTRVASRASALARSASLQAQVRELEATVDRLMIENVGLREAEIERAILREALQFKQANPTYEMLAAEVIGRDPSNLLQYILIDRGTDDGLAIGMPVVTARGLVGKITAIYPRSARVMLLTDSASSVNALIQSSRATGVLAGQGRGELIMRYVEQREQVQPGDVVLTSGLGGNFPRRLVIGLVTAVKASAVDMFQEVQVQSAVDFSRLEMVLVIRSFVPIESSP